MDALKLRKDIKKKKPRFRMTGYRERPCVRDRWRHPKGTDNKIAKGLKGYPKKIKVGYGSPGAAKDLHPSGFAIIIVNNIDELGKMDAKTQGACISSTVGKKKRLDIIKKCSELGIKILNFKNAEEYAKKINEEIAAKREAKKRKGEEKEKKKKEKEKKAAEKEKKEITKEDKKDIADKIEESKEKEEQEKQKVLTKKE